VKEFLKSINIWQKYGQEYMSSFFWLTLYYNSDHVWSSWD